MHGMLSLAVLVAAFAGLAGWIGYLLVRLYLACPAARLTPAHSPADSPGGCLADPAHPADLADSADSVGSADLASAAGPDESSSAGDPAAPLSGSDPAGDQAATREPVA
jgi:predicted lipid-binding transport protein (Tim44 family)